MRRNEAVLRQILAAPLASIVMCVDLEWYEHSSKDDQIMTEVGICSCTTEDGQMGRVDELQTKHYIIEEHILYVNQDCVSDHRWDFSRGQSPVLHLADVKKKWRDTFHAFS